MDVITSTRTILFRQFTEVDVELYTIASCQYINLWGFFFNSIASYHIKYVTWRSIILIYHRSKMIIGTLKIRSSCDGKLIQSDIFQFDTVLNCKSDRKQPCVMAQSFVTFAGCKQDTGLPIDANIFPNCF